MAFNFSLEFNFGKQYRDKPTKRIPSLTKNLVNNVPGVACGPFAALAEYE